MLESVLEPKWLRLMQSSLLSPSLPPLPLQGGWKGSFTIAAYFLGKELGTADLLCLAVWGHSLALFDIQEFL